MQIKTITCHEVYKHGASLQEYALLGFLKIKPIFLNDTKDHHYANLQSF